MWSYVSCDGIIIKLKIIDEMQAVYIGTFILFEACSGEAKKRLRPIIYIYFYRFIQEDNV